MVKPHALGVRLALRQTEGLIGSIIGLIGLTLAVPDHAGPRPNSLFCLALGAAGLVPLACRRR